MRESVSRRTFLVTTAGVAATMGCATQGDTTGEGQHAMNRPNVLVIHADQHRCDCIGAYGNKDIRTPNIDALAAEGARFDNSYCSYPVCTPSRYSLLAGRYVHEHNGWSNRCTLDPAIDTFPKQLRAAGYRTKAIGKMHFTPTYLEVGFEEMILSEQDGEGRWDDDYHRALRDHGLVDVNDIEDQRREYRKDAPQEYWDTCGALASNLPTEWHTTEWIGKHAAEELEAWEAGGNLLMTGFVKPHHPFDPPAEWADRYDPDALDLLPGWIEACLQHDAEFSKGYFPHTKLTEKQLRRAMAYYYATIEEIDAQVGKMVEILKRKGLYDNTMIIYTSDHGEYMGYHHLLLKGNHLYDALARVPLIIKYPKGIQAGTASDGLVSNVDVAPTILNQLGLTPPAEMHGQDLAKDADTRDVVFCEGHHGSYVMARTKTRKLLYHQGKKITLFYDLEADPLEMNSLHDDPARQDEIQALVKAIHDWRSFDSLQETYVDHDAPLIQQPNVPKPEERDAMIQYYKEAVAREKAKS